MALALTISAPEPPRAGDDGIRAAELWRHVSYLASDSLAGRETGRPGVRKAERYIAREFKRVGLSPLPGREDYWVDFTLYRSGYAADGTSLAIDLGGRSKHGRAGIDFRPFPFSDEGVVEAPVVFVGYGITAPEHAYDDYGGIDVAGKIVLMLRHEPGEADPDSSFDGAASSRHARFTTKAGNAREHGAVGMLLVTDPLHHGPDEDLRLDGALSLTRPEEPNSETDATSAEPFLAVHVGQQLASKIAASAGHTLETLQRAVDGGAPAADFAMDGVRARIAVERSASTVAVPARNVAGFLEGRDPEMKDEWIVIGAHHDHLGGHPGGGDTVYNGADDNASGTAGVLALARAFAARPTGPRRSMAFVTFSGEEKGLLGSRALVEQRLISLDRIAFMLNLDMIGRNPDRSVQLYGDGYGRGVREIVDAANREIELPIDVAGARYAGNSDHDAFFEEGIPFLFFFTGVHDDYHQLGDHADKLDYDRMETIVRLTYDDGKRAVVSAVNEGSRAASAGLAAGDVVLAVGDAPRDPEQVGRRIQDVEPGTRVTLALRRAGGDLALSVERARAGFLGLAPGPIDDDRRRAHGLHGDEGFLLRQVVAGGPAERAGLQVGDIVTAISGRPVGRSNLRRRLMQIGAGETVDVTVIREDECFTLPVTLGEQPDRR
jgi:hypothetical protein